VANIKQETKAVVVKEQKGGEMENIPVIACKDKRA